MAQVIDPDGELVTVIPYVDPARASRLLDQWFAAPDGAVSMLPGRTVSYAELYAEQLWVGACVDRLLTWSLLVPLKTYRRTGPDGEREQVRDHPLAAAIGAPWAGAGAVHLVQHLLGPKLVHGNTLARVRSGASDKLQFEPKDWRVVRPVRESPTAAIPGPIVGWVEHDPLGEDHGLPLDETLHIASWSPLGPLGVSPLRQLGVTLQIEDAAQRWARSTLQRSFRPSGVVEIAPEYLKLDDPEQQKLYDATALRLRSMYGGADRAGTPPIFPPGISWKDAAPSTAVEVRLLEQRRVNREEAAAIYQVPAPMVGILDKATYSNISTLRQVAYTDGLAPPLVMVEATINSRVCRELLGEPDLFVEFDFSGVLRGDKLREIQALREAISSALMTPNEGRDVLNKPRSPNPLANDLFIQASNYKPLGSLNASGDTGDTGQ
jgi:HK97 family phage portal protein